MGSCNRASAPSPASAPGSEGVGRPGGLGRWASLAPGPLAPGPLAPGRFGAGLAGSGRLGRGLLARGLLALLAGGAAPAPAAPSPAAPPPAILAAAVPAPAVPAPAPPPAVPRVLSLNLCTDQLLIALAAPGQIEAVTRGAADCRLSVACAQAARLPQVRGTAEEVVLRRPGLVIGGRYTAGPAIAAARRLGIPTLVLDPATSLADIETQIAAVADAIGRPAQGRALIEAFAARLAALPPPPPRRPLAAIYQANGFTVGAGSLPGDVLRRAGLANLAEQDGIDRYGVLPLEVLVWRRPDLLITDEAGGGPSRATALLDHPVLGAAFAGRRVRIPARLWLCGLPQTLDAVERLARAVPR